MKEKKHFNNLLRQTLDTAPFYSKLLAFLLQHFFSFLPDLFRSPPLSPHHAGQASLSTLLQSLGTSSIGLSLPAIVRLA